MSGCPHHPNGECRAEYVPQTRTLAVETPPPVEAGTPVDFRLNTDLPTDEQIARAQLQGEVLAKLGAA